MQNQFDWCIQLSKSLRTYGLKAVAFRSLLVRAGFHPKTQGSRLCTLCGSICHPPRRWYCSDTCAKHWMQMFNWHTICKRVKRRDHYTCLDCGCNNRNRTQHSAHSTHHTFNVHHIIPLTKGGLTVDENLITLCKKCHRMRHTKT